MRVRSFLPIIGLLGALVASPGHASGSEIDCSTEGSSIAAISTAGIHLTSSLGLTPGRYALPSDPYAAKNLVVMFHGHQNDSCSWMNHLRQAADRGAIAVAMDYSGTQQSPKLDYGWPVRSGAADSIAAARKLLAIYGDKTVTAFGISMGGNISGFAVASPAATKADGSKLFADWIDVEGVNSILDEYVYVRGLGPAVASAAEAQAEIEQENGGPIESAPNKYLEINNVTRAVDMSYLKGAVVVNGLDDSLVPTEQSDEMTTALHAVAVPTHAFNVIGSGGAESGSTYSSVVAQPLYSAAGLGSYNSPLAGHGWEGSDTQLVIKTGFDQLWSLLAGTPITDGQTPVLGVAGN